MAVPHRFSYGLASLFWVAAVIALICGVGVWTGVGGVIVFIALATGLFSGLYICSLLDLGFAFTDLRIDIAKCMVVAGTVTALAFFLSRVYGIGGSGLFPITWLIAVKLCWFDLEQAELWLLFAATFVPASMVAMCALSSVGG